MADQGEEMLRYFCYQCNKEVAVEGSQGAMTCGECTGGFLEAIATVNPEFRRPTRRRRRRVTADATATAAVDGDTISLSDALEHMYPHQMLQMVQLLLDAARTNHNNNNNSFNRLANAGAGAAVQEEEEGEVTQEAGRVTAADGSNEGHLMILRERQPAAGQDDRDHEHDHSEGESDGEEVGGLRLELEAFDLNDEDEDDDDDEEWEEAEEEEVGIHLTAETNNSNNGVTAEETDVDVVEESVRVARRNLTHYMRELLQNLLDQNMEVRVELPDLYLGNPGDYLDARGFEQLLQHLAENDNSRRGAPPAAKAAVEKLNMVKISQGHIDSGIAVCAICKEVMMLDEPAKQLPCLHLYHQDCIMPWLSSRNSCPVCRYELPTDDPDYEEQKKSKRSEQQDFAGGAVAGAEDQQEQESCDRGQNSGGSSVSAAEEGEEEVRSSRSIDEGEENNQQRQENNYGITMIAEGDDDGSPSQQNRSSSSRTGEENNYGITTIAEGEDGSSPQQNRSSSRSWLILAVGPVLSVMGFVFISLANHLVGRHMMQSLQLNDLTPAQRHWWFFS